MEYMLYYGFTLIVVMLIFLKLIVGWKGRGGGHGQRWPPLVPGSLPLLGHLHLLTGPIHQALARLAARHGPVIRIQAGSRPVVVVSSASAAEECLTTHDLNFANRPRMTSAEHFGYGYTTVDFASYGPLWRNLRRLMSMQILSPGRIAALSAIRTNEVRTQLWRLCIYPGKVDMRNFFAEVTFAVMTRTVMGRTYDAEEKEDREFRRIIEEVFALMGTMCLDDFVPVVRCFGRLFGGGVKGKIEKVAKEMDEMLQRLVDERRRQRNLGEVKEKAVIDELLALQEADPGYYSDNLVKGMLLTLLSSGTDTVKMTLEWAMSLLVNHPDSLKKAKDEIDAHVGRERLLTDADLPKLHYLNNIMKETLRLFPPIPIMLPHESAADCTVSGYDIPSGTLLLINSFVIHRDPKLWLEPSKFNPERFDTVSEGKNFRYIAFGSGRRGCPGENFGNRMMGLTLGSMIQCCEWSRVGEKPEDMAEGQGLAMPKAVPLEAICKPFPDTLDFLGKI